MVHIHIKEKESKEKKNMEICLIALNAHNI